jgi:hypothetical protein
VCLFVVGGTLVVPGAGAHVRHHEESELVQEGGPVEGDRREGKTSQGRC